MHIGGLHEFATRAGHPLDIARRLVNARPGENVDEDGWADVGSGVLDWKALSLAARNAGAQWLVAEHDKPNDPARFTRASFASAALTAPAS